MSGWFSKKTFFLLIYKSAARQRCPAAFSCSSRRPTKAPCLCPHVDLYRALTEVALTAQIWGQEGARGQALPADLKAHPGTPCSPYLPSTPMTICTYMIWGSSGPNKSHVLITLKVQWLQGCSRSSSAFKVRPREQVTLQTRYGCPAVSCTCLPCFHPRGAVAPKSRGTKLIHSGLCGLWNK